MEEIHLVARCWVFLELLCAGLGLLVCLGSRNRLILMMVLVGLCCDRSLMVVATFRSIDHQVGHFEGSKSHELG